MDLNEIIIIDFSRLEDLADGDNEFFEEMIEIFSEDSPITIAEMRTAFDSADYTQLIHTAHALKGSAANFGANNLADRAKIIEYNAKDNLPLDSMKAALELIELGWPEIDKTLKQRLTK